MLEIRLNGTAEENRKFIEWLDGQPLRLLRVSQSYPNRRDGRDVTERVYVDLVFLEERECENKENLCKKTEEGSTTITGQPRG